MQSDREKLVKLLKDADKACDQQDCETCSFRVIEPQSCSYGFIANYLVANGIVIQKQGEWLLVEEQRNRLLYQCSACKRTVAITPTDIIERKYPHCKYCGVEMVKEDK